LYRISAREREGEEKGRERGRDSVIEDRKPRFVQLIRAEEDQKKRTMNNLGI
jgi:hypothetical protein